MNDHLQHALNLSASVQSKNLMFRYHAWVRGPSETTTETQRQRSSTNRVVTNTVSDRIRCTRWHRAALTAGRLHPGGRMSLVDPHLNKQDCAYIQPDLQIALWSATQSSKNPRQQTHKEFRRVKTAQGADRKANHTWQRNNTQGKGGHRDAKTKIRTSSASTRLRNYSMFYFALEGAPWKSHDLCFLETSTITLPGWILPGNFHSVSDDRKETCVTNYFAIEWKNDSQKQIPTDTEPTFNNHQQEPWADTQENMLICIDVFLSTSLPVTLVAFTWLSWNAVLIFLNHAAYKRMDLVMMRILKQVLPPTKSTLLG